METIIIGYKTYTIEKREGSEAYDEGQKYLGLIQYNQNKIYLNNILQDDDEKETLLHEVLHGLSNMYDLDLDEELVTRLSKALYITLKQNELKIVKKNK